MKRILIIQTAFIGDVILATALIEKISAFYPGVEIDFLLRKGNGSLLKSHPKIHEVLIWNKKQKKLKHLIGLLKQIRSVKYNAVISAQRFASSGLLVAYSKAEQRIGFKKNPFSFKFTHKADHSIDSGVHEIDRNQQLISLMTDNVSCKPALYPSAEDRASIEIYQEDDYVCMAPSSVWFTKQLPKQKWLSLIQKFKSEHVKIYLLGGPTDIVHNDYIMASAFQDNVVNLAGKLSFLESCALMQDAKMNYVNDSGPLHMASAVNAPVTAFFCSTIPQFGFGPLSDKSTVIEVSEKLQCRPCGLHGRKSCPEKHFKCGHEIRLPEVF